MEVLSLGGSGEEATRPGGGAWQGRGRLPARSHMPSCHRCRLLQTRPQHYFLHSLKGEMQGWNRDPVPSSNVYENDAQVKSQCWSVQCWSEISMFLLTYYLLSNILA